MIETNLENPGFCPGLAMGPVVSVAAYGHLLVEAAYSGTLVVRDIRSTAVLDIAQTSHLVTCAAFSPDGRRLAVGTADNHGIIFDIHAGGRLVPCAIVPTADDVETAAFSADGGHVLFGGQDRTVTVARPSGEIVALHRGHRGVVNSIQSLADGRIASVADDGEVHVWHPDSPHEFDRTCLASDINTLAVCPDGGILTGCDRGRITRLGHAGEIHAHSSAVKNIALDASGRRGVSVGYDQKACLFSFQPAGLTVERSIDLPAMVWPKGVCFADEKIVFGSFRSGSVIYCMRENAFLNLEALAPYPSFNSVAFHKGRVFAAGDSGIVQSGGRTTARLSGPINALLSAHGMLVAGGQTGHLTLAENTSPIAAFGRPINTLACGHASSKRLLWAGLYGGAVAQFEFDGSVFRSLGEVQLHDNAIKGLAVHGNVLCSAAADGTVKFHEFGETGISKAGEHRFQKAHGQIANDVSVMEDGTFVSVGRDRKLLVWRSPDRAASFDAPVRNSLKCVAAGAGHYIAVGDYRGMLAIFDAALGEWLRSAKVSRWGISSITAGADGFIAATFGGELIEVTPAGDFLCPAHPEEKVALELA